MSNNQHSSEELCLYVADVSKSPYSGGTLVGWTSIQSWMK